MPQFSSKLAQPSETRNAEDRRIWRHGTIVIGAPVTGAIPGEAAAVPGELSAIRVDGMPALLLTDVTTAMRAARLLATPSLAAARGLSQVSVADVARPPLPHDRVSFDQLGLRLAPVEVYGRAELNATLDTRALPANTRASRLLLDVLVAPDGLDNKAVVSLFINGHFLSSTVAASGEPTRIEQALPERPGRHRGEHQGGGAAAQRRRQRMPLPAAGLSGANPGLQRRHPGAGRQRA